MSLANQIAVMTVSFQKVFEIMKAYGILLIQTVDETSEKLWYATDNFEPAGKIKQS